MLNRFFSMVLLLCALCVYGAGVAASEEQRRRVEMAASVFPRVVAVDEDVAEKLGEDRSISLLLVYETSERAAADAKDSINKKSPKVGAYNVSVTMVSAEQALALDKNTYTAIILVERLERNHFRELAKKSVVTGRMLMSPFEGDVEAGAMVGLFIGSRIVPWFNMRVLTESGVRINAKLLEVSRRYE